jgi:hypothetical protein
VKAESGSQRVVLRKIDLRYFMSFAVFFSAAVMLRLDLPVLYEVPSLRSFMILTFLRSAAGYDSFYMNSCGASIGEFKVSC